jgi:hypothetical protein
MAVGFFVKERHRIEGKTISLNVTLKVNGQLLGTKSPTQTKGFETLPLLQEIGFSAHEIKAALNEDSAYNRRIVN